MKRMLFAALLALGFLALPAIAQQLQYNATPPTLTDGNFGQLQGDVSGSLKSVLQAGTAYVGQSAAPVQFVEITPTIDTAIYAAGDTLFDRTLVNGACRTTNAPCVLESITFLDEDDEAAANLTFYVLYADVAFGTINNAPSISDANARNIACVVPMASTLILDVGGAKVGSLHNIGCVLKPGTGTDDVWIAATTAGTPTFTAATDIKLRLGFVSQ